MPGAHAYAKHSAVVRSWLAGLRREGDPDELIDLLDQTLAALWRRAQTTVSQVVLSAIMERVMANGCDRFPWLCVVRVEATGACFDELRRSPPPVVPARVKDAVQFLLTEFISTIAHLTGQILAADLHDELLKQSLDRRKRKREGKNPP